MARLTLSEQLAQAQASLARYSERAGAHKEEIDSLKQEVNRDRIALTAQHQLAVAELEKKLKSKEESYNYQASRLTLAENEIEQAHAVLDGVEGAPERSFKKNDDYGGTVQRNVVTRLAGAFLAIARSGGVAK